jgi:hypothetical protein
MESDVIKVIKEPRVRITRVVGRPAEPTIHPMRRKIMTPNMVKIPGRKTPIKVPNPSLDSV